MELFRNSKLLFPFLILFLDRFQRLANRCVYFLSLCRAQGLKEGHVRSLLSKIDGVRIWAKSTDADGIVFSETWLSKSDFDKDIWISGYNVYHTDRVKKGGGVAIYVKTKFPVSVAKFETICKTVGMSCFEYWGFKEPLYNCDWLL